jgi:hypothetical protein
MASLMGRISQLARSRQGRQMIDRAQRAARDPATRQRITEARQKLARTRSGRSR